MDELEAVDDLLRLTSCNIHTVTQTLISRFSNGKIYTWLGDGVLILFNPNRYYPDLYSLDYQLCITKAPYFHHIPHIYSLAEKCMRSMSESNSNQSVIITGTSGSGKTETTKHVLRYLTLRSSSKRHKQTSTESHIENVILQSNPILEALGNARTMHNDNSSRFGKYTRLMFNRDQVMIGADITVYLLEKPRALLNHFSLPNSFHIFRWFVASLGESGCLHSHLSDYYSQLSGYSAESLEELQSSWNTLTNAFKSLKLSDDNLINLQHLLTALLLLNSVRFVHDEQKDNLCNQSSKPESTLNYLTSRACIHPQDNQKVCEAGKMLGISEDLLKTFSDKLLRHHFRPGSQSSRRITVYASACTVFEAMEQRDNLVKSLYSDLFHYVVNLVNKQFICNSAVDHSLSNELGLLDLFGFENLQSNSFEQFCINYANERLHQVFMNLAVHSARSELRSEGLQPNFTLENEQVDNQTDEHISQLLSHCDNTLILNAMGIMSNLLDEVCLLKRVHNRPAEKTNLLDPREVDWLKRLNSVHSRNKCVNKNQTNDKQISSTVVRLPLKSEFDKMDINDTFTVRHYAGPVVYTVKGFVVKNLDRTPHSLLQWLVESIDANKSFLLSLISTGTNCPKNNHNLPCVNGDSQSPLQKSSSNIVESPDILKSRTPPASFETGSCRSPSLNQRSVSRRINTLSGNFKASLNQLLDTLESHELSFVRCIRPNSIGHCSSQHQVQIALNCVEDQIVNGGLLAAVEVLHSVYPTRYTYETFLEKYKVFWRLSAHSSSSLSNYHFGLLNSWYLKLIHLPRHPSKRNSSALRRETGESVIQQQQQITLILITLGLNIRPHQSTEFCANNDLTDASALISAIDQSLPIIKQFGRTRLHLTLLQSEKLEKLRCLMLNVSAKIIQRYFRTLHTRSISVRCIQRWWRIVSANAVKRRLLIDSITLTDSEKPVAPTPIVLIKEKNVVSQRRIFSEHSISRNHKQTFRLNYLVPNSHRNDIYTVRKYFLPICGLCDALL